MLTVQRVDIFPVRDVQSPVPGNRCRSEDFLWQARTTSGKGRPDVCDQIAVPVKAQDTIGESADQDGSVGGRGKIGESPDSPGGQEQTTSPSGS